MSDEPNEFTIYDMTLIAIITLIAGRFMIFPSSWGEWFYYLIYYPWLVCIGIFARMAAPHIEKWINGDSGK